MREVVMSNMTNEGVVELVKQSFDTSYVQQKNVKVSDNDLIDNLYLIVLVHCASYIDQEKLYDLEDSYKCLPHDDSRLFSHLLKKKI